MHFCNNLVTASLFHCNVIFTIAKSPFVLFTSHLSQSCIYLCDNHIEGIKYLLSAQMNESMAQCVLVRSYRI